MTDFLNALVILANFILVPGLAYGSQLALGALGPRRSEHAAKGTGWSLWSECRTGSMTRPRADHAMNP